MHFSTAGGLRRDSRGTITQPISESQAIPMRQIHGIDIDDFTYAYLMCALWASNDDDDTPLDDNNSPEDLPPCTLAKAKEDCDNFRQLNWTHTNPKAPEGQTQTTRTVQEWMDAIPRKSHYTSSSGERWGTAEQDGHDFWLTRNGHGAGFWDRGYPEPYGTVLTDAAHSFGSTDLYIGDDGKIYQS